MVILALGGVLKMKNVKGVIFDLNGTLLDSMYIWHKASDRYLVSRGVTPDFNINGAAAAMSLDQVADYYQQQYKLMGNINHIIDGITDMIDDMYAKVVLKAGVPSVLKKFKQAGVNMCVATTATNNYVAERALKNNNVLQYFSDILTCSELGFGKDNAMLFNHALKKLGTCKESTLVFEDDLTAIQTAKAASFKVVGVYDNYAQNHQSEIQSLSDYYIKSFDDWSEMYG